MLQLVVQIKKKNSMKTYYVGIDKLDKNAKTDPGTCICYIWHGMSPTLHLPWLGERLPRYEKAEQTPTMTPSCERLENVVVGG